MLTEPAPLNRRARRLLSGVTRAANRERLTAARSLRVEPSRVSVSTWLRSQPASTRRGYARGRFQLPHYVYEDENYV
jgi:hypothetical protein